MTKWQHPELRPGEIFLGNIYASDFQHVGWQTKRLGEKVFGRGGTTISSGQQRPCFVQRSEVEAAGGDADAEPIDHRW